MKKIGILNQLISEVIAGMGHGDTLVIGDCGLPIPPAVRRIDLALTPGVPGFLETLQAVLRELAVESALAASEMPVVSPGLYKEMQNLTDGIPLNLVDHEQFKEMTKKAVAVIRTGECTSYANIILKSGVIF
ncbi:d-ribose pyranase rbsd/l-fucose mutarotase fucu [Lucifera butyrica]|uniref:D-ribose pyranase n=1 Tax=Lucifera butyrica TaxID=1351585 RepID=A0A498R5E6_9FIRM|nr:D-ribose pyranase [Lucifera butyrica]VBB05413.1 d-ribose pyranase rbsd/l-fucose mutarotase fucu [Lucifera butyrica]